MKAISHIPGYLLVVVLNLPFSNTVAQDTERPLPPILEMISVDPFTGNTSLTWLPGGSPDVAGYIIYTYLEGEGTAVDTVYNPTATSYMHTKSNADIMAVSYVVAAIDSSDNISPLSNDLRTVFLISDLDTCNHEIDLIWNSYTESLYTVNEYVIKYSLNNGPLLEAGINPGNDTSFVITTFETGSEYCFIVEARLGSTRVSTSIGSCLETNLLKPPDWINADYTMIDENDIIEISFSYDTSSEINRFVLERSENPESGYQSIETITSVTGNILFNLSWEGNGIYYYRLAALNECNEPLVYSNISSLIIASATDLNNQVSVSWNNYYSWLGEIDNYIIYRNHTGVFQEVAWLEHDDTIYVDDLYPLYREVINDSICYYVLATETLNPYLSGAQSRSQTICIEAPVRIFVPNAFTPDDDLLNDTFRPVLSFTPSSYKLIIKSRAGITLFESSDWLESWDGRSGGEILAQDLYLWFLEVSVPSGRIITRSGTVTIIL